MNRVQGRYLGGSHIGATFQRWDDVSQGGAGVARRVFEEFQDEPDLTGLTSWSGSELGIRALQPGKCHMLSGQTQSGSWGGGCRPVRSTDMEKERVFQVEGTE